MVEYHQNLHVPVVSRADRRDLWSDRSVRARSGGCGPSCDQGFALSSLQSEQPPTVGTLLKGAQLSRELTNDSHFTLTYRHVDVYAGGLVAVSDAALGNVNEDGTTRAMGASSFSPRDAMLCSSRTQSWSRGSAESTFGVTKSPGCAAAPTRPRLWALRKRWTPGSSGALPGLPGGDPRRDPAGGPPQRVPSALGSRYRCQRCA